MRSRAGVAVVVFLLGFCSICYELILASKLSRLSGKGIFVYPACLGVFILFMGLGSALWYRRSKEVERSSLKALLWTELLLTVSGYLSIILIDLSRVMFHWFLNLQAYLAGFILAAWIGLLTGQELPLVFHFCSHAGWGQREVRRLIFADYLAGFFASLAVTIVLFPVFGILQSAIIVSAFNLAAMLMIFLIIPEKGRLFRAGFSCAIACLVLVYSVSLAGLDRIEDRMVKSIYAGKRNCSLLERFDTRYAQVMMFVGRHDAAPVKRKREEILAHPEDYYLYAYLNEVLQFFNRLGVASDHYHTFMIDPFVRLLPDIRHVLILGGGDGLPARQAVKYPGIRSIDMVDLDGEWVEFTRTDPFMRLNTHDALNDPRLKLHYMDAFRWVLRAPGKYDAVFVDFPEDDNVAAVRTVSIQFFRDLKRILDPDGVIVIQNGSEPGEVLRTSAFRTAEEAGMFPLYGYLRDDMRPSDEAYQLAMFKREEVRELYLDRFHGLYLKDDRYGDANEHMTYTEVEPGERWISYYDPNILRIRLRDLLDVLWGSPDG